VHGVRARGFCVPIFEFSTVRSGTTSFIPTEFVAYFADKTVQVVFDDTTGRSAVEVIHNKTGRPLLVPIIVGAELRRYARVPAGSENCAFCEFLASRGFVYRSGESAGVSRKYHPHCDCQIVPAWGKKTPKIAGYDPDALYAQYEAARDAVVARKQGKHGYSPSDAEVAAQMKKDLNLESEAYAIPEHVRALWPAELSPLRSKAWGHMLKRHGENGSGRTWFEGLSSDEIADVLLYAVKNTEFMKSPDNRHQYMAVVDVPEIGLVRVAAKLAKDPEYLGKIDVLSIFPIKTW